MVFILPEVSGVSQAGTARIRSVTVPSRYSDTPTTRPSVPGVGRSPVARASAAAFNAAIPTSGIPMSRRRSARSARAGFTATPAAVTRASIVSPGVVSVPTRPTIFGNPAAISRHVVHVPDAGHSVAIKLAETDENIHSVVLTTEEEGIGYIAGAWLGGERSALLLQSSGVGNCINNLALQARRARASIRLDFPYETCSGLSRPGCVSVLVGTIPFAKRHRVPPIAWRTPDCMASPA